MKRIFVILSALILSACAGTTSTLTASQCAADWGNVGYADGAEGATSAKLADYRAACAASGAALSSADEAAWREGRDNGLDAFCEAAPGALSNEQLAVQGQQCSTQTAALAHRGAIYGHRQRHSPSYGYYGPRISPFLSVGFGSGGTRVRSGVGIGFGVFKFGFFH